MDNLEEKLDCVEKNLENIESLEEAAFYAGIDVFNYCSKTYAELVKRGVEFKFKEVNQEADMKQFLFTKFVLDVTRYFITEERGD